MEEAVRLRERQIRWEIEGVNRGIARYREAQEDAKMADTDPGKRILASLIGPLVKAIEAAQLEVTETLANNKAGRWQSWWMPVLCLEADKLALITLRATLNWPNGGTPVPEMTKVAIKVGSEAKLQREFDLWKEAQAAGAKEGAINLYNVMVRSVKKIDARTATKWMKKSKEFDRIDWTQEVRLSLGCKLIELAVEHGQGFFEVIVVSSGVGARRTTKRHLQLTELAEAFCADINDTSELNRPWLMPMLCPPAPWREVA